jgi:hypothetical protein
MHCCTSFKDELLHVAYASCYTSYPLCYTVVVQLLSAEMLLFYHSWQIVLLYMMYAMRHASDAHCYQNVKHDTLLLLACA